MRLRTILLSAVAGIALTSAAHAADTTTEQAKPQGMPGMSAPSRGAAIVHTDTDKAKPESDRTAREDALTDQDADVSLGEAESSSGTEEERNLAAEATSTEPDTESGDTAATPSNMEEDPSVDLAAESHQNRSGASAQSTPAEAMPKQAGTADTAASVSGQGSAAAAAASAQRESSSAAGSAGGGSTAAEMNTGRASGMSETRQETRTIGDDIRTTEGATDWAPAEPGAIGGATAEGQAAATDSQVTGGASSTAMGRATGTAAGGNKTDPTDDAAGATPPVTADTAVDQAAPAPGSNLGKASLATGDAIGTDRSPAATGGAPSGTVEAETSPTADAGTARPGAAGRTGGGQVPDNGQAQGDGQLNKSLARDGYGPGAATGQAGGAGAGATGPGGVSAGASTGNVGGGGN